MGNEVPEGASGAEGGGCHAHGVVRYEQLDVLGETFVPELQRLVLDAGRPAVLLGMHLCGFLSLRAVEAFQRIVELQCVILSPCCLPGKGEAASPAHLFATKDSGQQYEL